MSGAQIKTAKESLINKQVEWVSVIETPVENFIRKNELVLSSGIGCGHDPVLFKEFVQDVLNSEASALAIATGRFVFEIPSEVLQLAEEHNFSIIAIPWEVRFSEITQVVITELSNLQRKDLERSEKIQQQLINLILQGKNLSSLATFVEENVDKPVVITDEKGKIKGNGKKSKKFTFEWDNYLQSNILPKPSFEIENSHHPLHTKIQKINLSNETILQMSIINSASNVQGYLFVRLPSAEGSVNSFLSNGIVNILEHAVTTSALWFLRESAIQETEMRLRDDFVWNLAKGEMSSWDEVLTRSSSLGYDVSVYYACIIGYPENLQELHQKNRSNQSSYDDWHQSMIHYLEEEVTHAGKYLNRKTMLTYQRNEVIIFLEVPNEKKNETVNNFLDLLERRLNNLLPGVVVSWGIGQRYEGIMTFRDSFNDAQVALEIGRKKLGHGYRMNYLDTRLDRVLLSLAEHSEIKEIILDTLGALVKYDKQRNMDLIGTFIAYNRNQGNVSKTSRALNFHRQSLLYRLRKIESLTGLTLVDPDDLFLLDLSIKIWLIGSEKNS